MTRLRPLLPALAVAAILLAGCAAQLRTAPAPLNACDEALASGRLVASAQSGLAIADSTGHVTEVLWPFGYTARQEAAGLALLDADGRVVAHQGDVIELGGGLGANNVWAACAGSVRVVPAQG